MIFLIGYMGSGKTTAARKLSKQLHVPYFDLDRSIEMHSGMSISEIFEAHGEAYFRKLEAKILRQTGSQKDVIISTGGGTPCFYDNMDWMNENGISIYLKMPPKALYSRLKNAKKNRPLIAKQQNPEAFITTHLMERELFYQQANITVNGLSLDIESLCTQIKELTS